MALVPPACATTCVSWVWSDWICVTSCVFVLQRLNRGDERSIRGRCHRRRHYRCRRHGCLHWRCGYIPVTVTVIALQLPPVAHTVIVSEPAFKPVSMSVESSRSPAPGTNSGSPKRHSSSHRKAKCSAPAPPRSSDLSCQRRLPRRRHRGRAGRAHGGVKRIAAAAGGANRDCVRAGVRAVKRERRAVHARLRDTTRSRSTRRNRLSRRKAKR